MKIKRPSVTDKPTTTKEIADNVEREMIRNLYAKVIDKLTKELVEERDALRDKVAGLQSGIDVALGLLERAIATIGEYKDSAALWETRYNEQTALASEVITERDEAKSERARALMALEFCKNLSARRGIRNETYEERLGEIYNRAAQIIGDDFDSYKTQLDLK